MATTYGEATAVAGGTNHAAAANRLSFSIQNVDTGAITVEFDALGAGTSGLVLAPATALGAGNGGAININRHVGALKIYGANVKYRWVEITR